MARRPDLYKARILALIEAAVEGQLVSPDTGDSSTLSVSSVDAGSCLVRAEVHRRAPRYFIVKVVEPW